MSTPVSTVHDSTVRALLGNPDVARAFFRTFLPPDLLARIDLESIEAKPDHFVDPRLGWRATDLLFRVLIDNQEAFIYLLFEHQSTVDRWMAWRLLRNMNLIWEKVLDEDANPRRLPIIVPIVLSQARERWSSPMQFQHLVADPNTLPDCLHDKVPSLSYFLFDLRGMTDAQIVSLATTASLRLFLLIMIVGTRCSAS